MGRRERGEYQGIYTALFDGPDFLALDSDARWLFIAMRLKLGAMSIQAVPAHRERATLCPDDAKRFLVALDGERLGGVFALMLLVGLRPEEALALQWDDWKGETLQVRRALVWLKGQSPTLERPKGKRARSIRLSGTAQRFLRRHKAGQAEERLALGAAYQDQGLVFGTEAGTYFAGRT